MFSVPRLVQFINTLNTTENFRLDSAKFAFNSKGVCVDVYPTGEAETYALSMRVLYQHLDWQVSIVAQIFNSLNQMFSAVEHLALEHEVHSQSSEEHNAVDRTEWRKLLRPFRSVKTLHIGNGLVEQLSRSLESKDGEFPLELPELLELTYSGDGNTGDAFIPFINARRNTGRPVALVLDQDM
jgi:hypothetical protein